MKTYEKTPNLYMRYKEKPHIGKYNTEQYMCKGFEKVRPEAWVYTEKIDGMNMRLILRRDPLSGVLDFDIRGRSDRAQIPGDLKATIIAMLHNRMDMLELLVGEDLDHGITLYGEGYGPGIQKGGGKYRDDKGFILFDIARWERVEDTTAQYYLHREDVEDVAENLGLIVVPRVFEGLGLDAVTKRVRASFKSQVGGGTREAEGIVGQADGLFHHWNGEIRRMKFKLKTKDFPS